MTREEAAQICQSVKFILENSDYTEAVEEALDMAIAALKQLSLPKIIIRQGEQEPCDKRTGTHECDCISRQDAMNELKEMQDYISYKIFCAENNPTEYAEDYIRNMEQQSVGIAHVEHRILELPSAQPFTSEQIQTMQELESAQVKKAYELGKADRPKGYWIDTQVDSVGIAHRCICSICGEEPAAWSSINKFDFCPNCGADMRERGEG